LKLGEQFRELFSGAPADNDFKDNAFPAVRHINVPAWSEAEFKDLLTKSKPLATAIAQGGAKLRDLAAVPFNTRLLADLVSTGVPATAFGGVGSQVELLAIYWGRRVVPLGNAADVCLRATVELMVTNHTLQAERLQVATAAPSALDALFKANVLVPVIGDRYVGFRHHILFDYAASRLFINPLDIGSIRTRLVAQPGLALMLAPALAYALHDLWLTSSSDHSDLWAAVVELTGKSPSDPVARSLAARMASVLPVEPADPAALARLVDSHASRPEAAKAFVHLVGALTVGIEDKVLTTFAPWCMLAADVSAHVDAIAWPLRTLLWQIVGMVTAVEQRAQLGTAARVLLAFALNDSRGASLVTVAIELVSDTYETDADASRAILRRLFAGDRFTAHAHEDMPALARKAKRLLDHDPDFVAEVYRVVFSKRIIDTSATSMGNSQILPMSSNRRQDYDHARWQLSQYVPDLLDTDPTLGIRLLTITAEGSVESEHPTDAEVVSIDVDGKTIHFLDDGSHVWAHNPGDSYAHADNMAGQLGAFKRRLLESPESDAVNLAQITIATNRLAVLWARMFLAAAKRPDVLGALMWPYASSSPFLKSVDTRKDAIDAVAAFYPTLSADDRKSFEEAVKTITFEEYENPERSKRRFLATLFRAIGDKNLATPEAKSVLAEALAESVPVGNNRVFSVFTETSTPDPYWWLTDKGVDVESRANAALLRLTEGLPDRPAPDGTQTQTISDGARALMALNAALQKPTQPLPSPLVTEYAQSQLLGGCVALARRKNELASEAGIVGALAHLIDSHLGDRNASGSSEPLDKLRALAAEAALSLCAVNQATVARLVPKIEPLLSVIPLPYRLESE